MKDNEQLDPALGHAQAMVEYEEQMRGEIAGFSHNARSPIFTTVDTTQEKGANEVLDALMSYESNANDFINRAFTIRDIVIMQKEYLPNAQGEVIVAVWSCIITTDGDRITFHSAGILDSLRSIWSMANGRPLSSMGQWELYRSGPAADKMMFRLRRYVERKRVEKNGK